ncbi:DUF861 domain-containing protein [Cryobacterium sp. TMT1-2-2]|uniref:cupin domain-containing protein n=1 Tax=Cryobacterium sp. TMT1-2-2 TaxID=1259233 RepID=UPI00106D0715|nr:cupin domain-containing protein [Cryobacterium sp. TMT1-2-2]TFD11685.1 DUF861 domain-containing protein [Cryobacterium sp. TMT1-2-2]
MTEQTSFSTSGTLNPDGYEPFELGVVQWIRKFDVGDRPGLACGFWHVTPDDAPEAFDLVSEADESIHIVSGRLRIEELGGEVHDLGPGSAASFNKGTPTRWTVLEPTIEFFVYS